jgi:hypothetical protein
MPSSMQVPIYPAREETLPRENGSKIHAPKFQVFYCRAPRQGPRDVSLAPPLLLEKKGGESQELLFRMAFPVFFHMKQQSLDVLPRFSVLPIRS